MEFDWDEGNRAKAQKHGLTLAEIKHAMRTGPRVAPDPMHSLHDEERFIAVGRTPSGRHAFIASAGARAASAPSARATCTRRRSPAMSRRSVPVMKTDEEADAFLEQDLSDLDHGAFRPLTLVSEAGSAHLEVELPEAMITAVRARAREKGISSERVIIDAIKVAVEDDK